MNMESELQRYSVFQITFKVRELMKNFEGSISVVLT